MISRLFQRRLEKNTEKLLRKPKRILLNSYQIDHYTMTVSSGNIRNEHSFVHMLVYIYILKPKFLSRLECVRS